MPLAEWFRAGTGLGKLAQQELTDASVAELGDRVRVSRLLDEHRSGRYDHGELLWTVLNFVLWKKVFKVA